MNRVTRLNKIQEVLENALGLIWSDRIVYSHSTKIYHTATIFDFEPGKATYAHLQDKNHKRYLARVVVDETSFIINMNGMKIDASEHWQEVYGSQLQPI